jgi:NAD(P)H-flavin reductase
MQTLEGRVNQVQLDQQGAISAWITCPLPKMPSPGQYLFAWAPSDTDTPTGVPLFPARVSGDGFLATPPLPPAWTPGTELYMRGPLGNGFALPASIRRLALAALDDSVARLLPLAALASQRGCAVTLFADGPLPTLPVSYEAYPLRNLPENLTWADLLAIELPLQRLSELHNVLGVAGSENLPCPAQVLIYTGMPFAGLAECGACAISTRRGYRLACMDGPVFDFHEIRP